MFSIQGTVYIITNLESGFQYVGQTRRSVQTRWSEHMSQRHESAGWFLNRAMREYEPQVWRFDVLKTITVDFDEEDIRESANAQLKSLLLQYELAEILKRNSQWLYNMSFSGRFPCTMCTFASGTSSGLAIHGRLQHDGPAWTECQKCESRISTPGSKGKTGFGLWCSECWLEFKATWFQFSCSLCSERFLWQAGLTKHIERQHSSALDLQQKVKYAHICSKVVNRERPCRKKHAKLWLDCGRQIAGKVKPQCFGSTFYF